MVAEAISGMCHMSGFASVGRELMYMVCFAGGSENQGANDGTGNNADWLSTSGQACQLLPPRHQQPAVDRR